MAVLFRVFTTAAFDRSLRKLTKGNPDALETFEHLANVLATDPQNTSRKHNIKKLTNIEPQNGQWRIRSGVYRLRYDIKADIVTLYSIHHRKDAY